MLSGTISSLSVPGLMKFIIELYSSQKTVLVVRMHDFYTIFILDSEIFNIFDLGETQCGNNEKLHIKVRDENLLMRYILSIPLCIF